MNEPSASASGARARLRRWWQRIKNALTFWRRRPGQWITGHHTQSGAALMLAPLVPPRRTYRLLLPSRPHNERLPLLVLIHGCKQNATEIAAGTQIEALAQRERWAVLCPEQTRFANPYNCWNWFDPSAYAGNGEAAIIAGMVRAVSAQYAIDHARVYVAGMSSGAALVSVLASCHAHLFAAAAVHSGLMFQAAAAPNAAMQAMKAGAQRDPARAAAEALRIDAAAARMPLCIVHGLADEVVAPINAEQIEQQFVAQNALSDAPVTATIAASAGTHAYSVIDHRRGELPVVRKILIEQLGHAWSGGDATLPFNDASGPAASELIWEFFRLHRRAEASEVASAA